MTEKIEIEYITVLKGDKKASKQKIKFPWGKRFTNVENAAIASQRLKNSILFSYDGAYWVTNKKTELIGQLYKGGLYGIKLTVIGRN